MLENIEDASLLAKLSQLRESSCQIVVGDIGDEVLTPVACENPFPYRRCKGAAEEWM